MVLRWNGELNCKEAAGALGSIMVNWVPDRAVTGWRRNTAFSTGNRFFIVGLRSMEEIYLADIVTPDGGYGIAPVRYLFRYKDANGVDRIFKVAFGTFLAWSIDGALARGSRATGGL